MNPALSTGPLAQAIGWALLHLLWQGTLVAAVLAAALALLEGRSARIRYALSCAALLAIVLLGVATGVRSYAPETSLAITPMPASAKLSLAPPAASSPDLVQGLVRSADRALPGLVALWLLGVVLCSLRLLREWRIARRLVAGSAPARAAWQAAANRLASALGVRRFVRLLESNAVAVPSVIGILRPAILLPACAATGLTPAQLEMILAHELAHVRRHDFLVNLLQSVVETLLFHHPAVWWISRRIRAERENCCDDLAIAACGSPLQYARALTRLEELRTDGLSLAVAATGGSLLARIRRIAGAPDPPRRPVVRGAAALSALACVALALVTLALPALGERPLDTAPAAVAEEPARPSLSAITGVPVAPEPAADPVSVAAAAPEADDEEVAAPEDEDRPTLDELIALRVQNVTPEMIEEMRELFPGIRLMDIASMSAVGATPDFVRAMRREGLEVREAQEATGLAAVGVSVAFLREIRTTGLAVRTAEEAQGMAAVGVTALYIRELRALGIDVRTTQEARTLAAVGVTPEYIRSMRRAGVEIGSPDEAQNLQALGVTPDFVERLARAGYRNLTVEQLGRLAAAGLTGGFVEEMSKYRTGSRERKPS